MVDWAFLSTWEFQIVFLIPGFGWSRPVCSKPLEWRFLSALQMIFLKDLFVFLFEMWSYRGKGECESSIRWFTTQMATMARVWLN